MKKFVVVLTLLLVPSLVDAQVIVSRKSGGGGVSNSAEVIALWTGTCNATTWLRGDGQCAAPAGGGNVVGPASSVDSEIALYNGASGTLLKRAAFTGLVLSTSGVASAYAGVTCANQFLRILSASGAGTCNSIVNTDIDAAAAIALTKLAIIADDTILANVSGGALPPSAQTLSVVLDAMIGSTQGNVIYRNAATWVVLPPGSNGQALTSGGAGANISWTTISGSGDVTAAGNFANDNRLIRSDGTGKGVQASGVILDDSNVISGFTIAAKGYNEATYNGVLFPVSEDAFRDKIESLLVLPNVVQGDILFADGVDTFDNLAKSTTAGHVLRNTGTSNNPAWGLVDVSLVTGDLLFSNLTQGSALSILGVTGNATADNASIAAASDHQVLRRNGTSLAFGAINLASSNAVSGTLPAANGPPRYIPFRAGICKNGTAFEGVGNFTDASGPTIGCRNGAANTSDAQYTFADDDTDRYVHFAFDITEPSVTAINLHLRWSSAATTGDVLWLVGLACTDLNGASNDTLVSTTGLVDTADGSANDENYFTGALTITGIATLEGCRGRIGRDRNGDAADTLTGQTVQLISWWFEIVR